MTVSGVLRVETFNESNIVLVTDLGMMTIEGLQLHINKLSLETGDMSIDGNIVGLFYSDNSGNPNEKGSNFFKKLFK